MRLLYLVFILLFTSCGVGFQYTTLNHAGHIDGIYSSNNPIPVGCRHIMNSCISEYHGLRTQGLIEILGFMVIFDENQGVSDLSKYEFLCPIYVKIIKFLVI